MSPVTKRPKLGWIIVGSALAGIALTLSVAAAEPEPVTPDPQPTSAVVTLDPCPTEDSTNCYWDADTMGNDQGTDVVTIDEPEPVTDPSTNEPEVTDPAPTIGEAEPATEHGYTLETWPYSHGETLVCGHDAKPALDYREDVGWWAYCEGALVP